MAEGEQLTPCKLGRQEHDGARFCHEHIGFLQAGMPHQLCDRSPLLADRPVIG